MKNRIQIAEDRHLETLGNCGGYYACPISEGTGERLGPLVGYAGKYTAEDGSQKQFVGDVYANFAMAEIHAHVLSYFATCLAMDLYHHVSPSQIDFLCGAPIGGYSITDALGLRFGYGMVKAEKKVVGWDAAKDREVTRLAFSRHSVESGANYLIVEDVCNNFSTTEELIKLIIAGGGTVLGIVCFLNRSLTVNDFYKSSATNKDLPVVSLVRMPIHEWRQDDPAVANDIARGNVCWKPKNDWDRLMKAMHA
jgi:orotate phosphoribosyltransferase